MTGCSVRSFFLGFLYLHIVLAQRKCQNLPKESAIGEGDYWVGAWQYYINREQTLGIDVNGQISGDNSYNGATCERIELYKNASTTSAFVWGNMVIRKPGCYGCLKFEQRTINVIEFKQSTCNFDTAEEAMRQCNSSAVGTFIQLFRASPKSVNCKNTFEGEFHFDYERKDNEGICDNSENRVQACQEPGSSYKDNDRFTQTFKKCPGNTASVDQKIEWLCLGTWKDPYSDHKVYSVIHDTAANLFTDKVKCLLSQDNQQLPENELRYTMSSTPTCNELQNEYEGSWRFKYKPALTPLQLGELQPSCMLPQNFSGTWFTSSQYDSKVVINSTHIQFDTVYTTFYSVETFFSCQQTRDTRYLMKQVTKGRCEVDYVCFEFLPRHQNIIRFRMGKPYRTRSDFAQESENAIFAKACSWTAFTISRSENVNYVYQTFILDPPAPVECPIAGIYNFTQIGVQEFKYETKIRGVTERPRVAYSCDLTESEFKVCASNPKIVNLDVERCASVDHVGRPLGEYDQPDNFLQCVGYWQENQKSYLVTHDTEDPVAPFRCWVYERLGWKDIRMSRALRATCGALQTPRSYSDIEGASLSLELHENEREFDDCPQKFLDGRDPYMKSTMVYVVGSAQTLTLSLTTISASCISLLLILV